MRNLKNYLINWISLFLLSNILIVSCSEGIKKDLSDKVKEVIIEKQNLICTEKDNTLFDEIEKGNLSAFKKFIKDGGDPCLTCMGERYIESISAAVLMSESEKVMLYYASLDISDVNKSDFLYYSLLGHDENKGINYPRIVEKLLKNDAVLTETSCFGIDTLVYENLKKHNYDIDVYDQYGSNAFLHACGCPCPEDENLEKVIQAIDYFIRIGANKHAKTKNGKSALQVAENPKIFAHLKKIGCK